MKEDKRVIKFRFWSPTKRIMRDEKSGWIEDIGINEAIHLTQSYGYVVMQFTGLLDKQGKEIYEGDIFKETIPSMSTEKFTGEQEYFIIVWDERYAAFAVKRQSRDENEEINKDWMAEIEIVGNVHQHPELLTPPTSKQGK